MSMPTPSKITFMFNSIKDMREFNDVLVKDNKKVIGKILYNLKLEDIDLTCNGATREQIMSGF